MKYLIDTDYVIDHLTGRPTALPKLSLMIKDGVGISLITYGEVYEGILFGRTPRRAEDAFNLFLEWVNVVPLDQEMMKVYAKINGELRRQGRSLSKSDILIAATAICLDLTLLTRNFRHFDRIDGLRLYSPENEHVSES